MLVGDVIVGARELIPDLPRSLLSPGIAPTAGVVASAGSTLPPDTYYIALTFTNQWGETVQSGAIQGPFVVAVGQGIQITAPLPSVAGGATGVKAYFGTNPLGPLLQMVASQVVPFVITAPGTPGQPPSRNTAFYPDSDGSTYSAFTIYRWLQEGLEEACKVCGGIPDDTGRATVANGSRYQLTGVWNKIDHAWWDGYPISITGKDDLFLRNVITGVSRSLTLFQSADRMVVELQPQPNRPGGQTIVAAGLPIGLLDTSFTAADISSFKLPMGLVQVESEIMYYSSINANVVGNIIRALGGTTQVAHPAGAPVSELNLHVSGMRQITPNQLQYLPGMASLTLFIPPAWKTALIEWILYRANEGQKLAQESSRKFQLFHQMMNSYLRGNKQVAGPRQVGGMMGSGGGLDVYQGAGLGGGIIIP